MSLISNIALCISEGSDGKFWKKTPQFHLIIAREWPKNAPSILRNHNNFPTGAFYLTPSPLQLGTKEYCMLSDWVSVGIEKPQE